MIPYFEFGRGILWLCPRTRCQNPELLLGKLNTANKTWIETRRAMYPAHMSFTLKVIYEWKYLRTQGQEPCTDSAAVSYEQRSQNEEFLWSYETSLQKKITIISWMA